MSPAYFTPKKRTKKSPKRYSSIPSKSGKEKIEAAKKLKAGKSQASEGEPRTRLRWSLRRRLEADRVGIVVGIRPSGLSGESMSDRCPKCAGRLDPTTDGMGRVIDFCPRCGLAPRSALHALPPKTPTMPSPEKPCKRSGKMFTPTGNNAKYCGKCDDCKAGTPAKKKPKAEVVERPRKVIRTGFVSETPRNTSGEYGPLIDQLRAELDTLAERREKIENAIAAIEGLAAA